MSEPTHIAGRLEIPVEADLSDFDRRLKAKVEAIANSIKAKVGIEWDDERDLRSTLKAKVEAASRGVTANVKAKIDVDRDNIEAAARKAATGVTTVLNKNGAEIKVEADDRATRQAVGIVARMKAWAAIQKVEVPVTMGAPRGPTPTPKGLNPYGPAGAVIRGPMLLGLVSLVQPLIALIMQSLGGLFAMIGAAGASLSTIYSVIPAITALGSAFAVGMIAFSGWDAEFKNTVPAMQAVKAEAANLEQNWSRLTRSVRRQTWNPVVGELEPMAQRLLPALNVGFSRLGRTMGTMMRDGLRFMNTKQFNRELTDMLRISNNVFNDLGRGFGGLLEWFVDVSIAAGPVTERISRAFRGFGEWAASLLDTVPERRRFDTWLQYAADKASELGRVLKNTWNALGGMFSAGRDAGDSLMATLERVTAKWNDWTRSDMGRARLKEWFDTAAQGTEATGRLLVELGRALARLGEDPAFAALADRLTTELLPALERFLRELGQTLGPVVVDFLSNLLEVLAQLSAASAPLAGVLVGLNVIVEGIGRAMEVVPGLAEALGLLIGAAIAARPAMFIVEGLSRGFGKLGRLPMGPFAAIIGFVLAMGGASGTLSGTGGAISSIALALGGMALLGPSIKRMGDDVALRMMYLGDAAKGATGKVGGLRGALGGIGAAAKTAGAGLFAALGGGWGIALGAGIALLASWWQEHKKSEAAIKEHTQALIDNAGAISELNIRKVAEEMDTPAIRRAAEELGISFETVVRNALGMPDAMREYDAALQRNAEANRETMAAVDGTGRAIQAGSGINTQARQDMQALGEATAEQRVILGEAGTAYDRYNEQGRIAAGVMEDLEGATGGANGEFDAAAGTLSAAAGWYQEAADRAREFRNALEQVVDLLKAQRELNLSQREALRAQRDAYRDAEDAVKRLADEHGSLAGALTESGDGFNNLSAIGDDLEGIFDGLIGSTDRAIDSIIANQGSVEELTETWAVGQEQLEKFAELVGLSPAGLQALREELDWTDADFQALVATLEEMPEEVSTGIFLNGVELTQEQVDNLKGEYGELPDIVTTTAKAETEEAKDQVLDLQAALDANPDEIVTGVRVPGADESRERVDLLRSAFGLMPLTKSTEVDAPGTDLTRGKVTLLRTAFGLMPVFKKTQVDAPGAVVARERIDLLRSTFGLMPLTKSTAIHAPGATPVRDAIQRVIDTAAKIPGSKSTTVTAYTSAASSALGGIIGLLRSITSKTVTVSTIHTRYNHTMNMPVADGAVVDFFNNGGFHNDRIAGRLARGMQKVEQHVAQIVPPGTWRVFGEDETGGEAYIPLAPGKRRRSRQILGEVADRFGYTLIPIAELMADGNVDFRKTPGFKVPGPIYREKPTNPSLRDQPGWRVPDPPRSDGTRVVFEEGSITVVNPTPEPASTSVATIARGFTTDGLWETGD